MKKTLSISSQFFFLVLISACSEKKPPSLPERELGRELSAKTQVSGVLDICSFNIQFLGYSGIRDNSALARLLKSCDLVFVQELVAPPYPGAYPDGTSFKPDLEAREFFYEMRKQGFSFWLSEEDTGPGVKIHNNSSRTEWWVAFYRAKKVAPAGQLPHGFLEQDRSNNPYFERVPYAFSFKERSGGADFVFISVHLPAGAHALSKKRRREELARVFSWVYENDSREKDFIIVGDMNVSDLDELEEALPPGFLTLNEACKKTNTHPTARCYDHVLYHPDYTTEIDRDIGFQVINLVEELEPNWSCKKADRSFPGRPYVHRLFKRYYSDHHPVRFRLRAEGDDD